jgi:hypothetical protein
VTGSYGEPDNAALLVSLNQLALVRLASVDQPNTVGVVSSRMALEPAPGKEGERVMVSADGPAQPDDYVAITVLGAAQVRVQAGEAIQSGQRLTVSDTPGQASALRTVDVAGPTFGQPRVSKSWREDSVSRE